MFWKIIEVYAFPGKIVTLIFISLYMLLFCTANEIEKKNEELQSFGKTHNPKLLVDLLMMIIINFILSTALYWYLLF